MKNTNNNLVCREDWFTLKKFQLKKKPTINDTKLPANVLKAIKKANEDSNLQVMDLEKAMMVANAKGAAIAVNKHLGLADSGQLYDHHNEKELYYSCYLPGMKAYLNGQLKKQDPKLMQKIEHELY